MGLSVFTFTQLFSKAKKRCTRRALTRDPTSFNVFFLENPTEYPQQTLYCQKVDSLPKIDAADSMCQLFCAKTEFNAK